MSMRTPTALAHAWGNDGTGAGTHWSLNTQLCWSGARELGAGGKDLVLDQIRHRLVAQICALFFSGLAAS